MSKLNDDEISALIREYFPDRKVREMLTYEKPVPLFPQETYSSPDLHITNFVRAIEQRSVGKPVVKTLKWISLDIPFFSHAPVFGISWRFLCNQSEGKWLLWLPGQTPETHEPIVNNTHDQHRECAQNLFDVMVRSMLETDHV